MGSLKEHMSNSNESLAEALGILPEELDEIDYTIHEQSSEDGLVYCYDVEFAEDTPLQILKKIKGLQGGRFVTLSSNFFDVYEDGLIDAVLNNRSPFDTFYAEILNTKKLIDVPLDSKLQSILYKQVFVTIIGLMETYLSDTLINKTLENEIFFENYIKSHPEFRARKFELREIFEQSQKITQTAKIVMLDTIYHKLPEVKETYISTFGIHFPSIQIMQKHVRDRHDIVHRSGERKDGTTIPLSADYLFELIQDTISFITQINQAICDIEYNLDPPF